MRLLVTGSRFADPAKHLKQMADVLQWIGNDTPRLMNIVVHGAATGADSIAAWILEQRGWIPEPYPADWEKYGKSAGPYRNQEMVDTGADLVVAFFIEGVESVGTADCVRRARIAGIPVLECTLHG